MLIKDFFIERLLGNAIARVKREHGLSDEEMATKSEKAYPVILRHAKRMLKNALLRNLKSILKQQSVEYRGFEKRLHLTYKSAFQALELFIEANKQISIETHVKYVRLLSNEDLAKFDVLIRLHGRACQVASEILNLLKSGYSDGAHARWRTLHELSATFLVLFTNETGVSKMYDDYETVESWKKAKKYMATYKTLGWRKIDSRTLKKVDAECVRLKNLYGKNFLKDYGWAQTICNGRFAFSEIEKIAGLSHLRFFYAWSCDNVHSGISGARKRLGLFDGDNRILMGPSNFGILDPARFTSYSLLQMTMCLLQLNDSIKNHLIRQIMEEMHDDITEKFSAVHKNIVLAEKHIRRRRKKVINE